MSLRALADRASLRLRAARQRLFGRHRLQRAAERGDINIGGHTVELGSLLGHRTHPGVSKAGRLSVAGYCDGRKVKVYSAFSGEQVALRRALQRVPLDGLKLPEIVAFDENLVAEAWIEGVSATSLRGRDLEQVKLQVETFLAGARHRPDLADLAQGHQDAFRYLEDYLVPRLGPWSHVEAIREFLETWNRQYANFQPQLPVLLSHPDLSLANLIREETAGDIVVVDNELLGAGRGWILDRTNSCLGHSSPQHGHTAEIAAFTEQTWQLRRLGSALYRGDLPGALAIVHERH